MTPELKTQEQFVQSLVDNVYGQRFDKGWLVDTVKTHTAVLYAELETLRAEKKHLEDEIQCLEDEADATQAQLEAVTKERDRLRSILKKVVDKMCTYCADGREVFERDGGYWHTVARGDDLGDTEPCKAHAIHSALATEALKPTSAGGGDE